MNQKTQEYLKKHEKYVAGIILALVLLSVIYWQRLSSLFASTPIFISLCNYDGYLDIRFIDAEKQHLYVPDYDAEIYIESLSDKTNIDSNIEFSYKIMDKGIQKLNKPYFYIFIFDPDDKLRAVFPCFCGQDKSDFSIGDDGYRMGYIFDKASKFKPWNKNIEWGQKNQRWHCTDKENYFCVNYQCISRKNFIDSSYDGKPLIYTYKVDKVGTWKIYSFLFEEEYKERKFNPSLSRDYFNNAIAYGSAKFEVVKESKKGIDFSWYLSQSIIILLTFAGSVVFCIKIYEIFKKGFLKYKNKIILGLVLFIALVILTLFFCKISCP